MDSQQQSSFLDDRAVKIKDERDKTFTVETDVIDIQSLMRRRTNKQLELKSFDPKSNKLKKNGVDVSLTPNDIKSIVYDFYRGFTGFVTNKDLTKKDIRDKENKIRLFLSNINYNRKRGDVKSIRVKLIRRIETSLALPKRNAQSTPPLF